MKDLVENKEYKELIENIGSVFNKAKSKIIIRSIESPFTKSN